MNNGEVPTSNVYGDGNSGKQIADKLADVPLRFHKTIHY